MKIFIKDGDGLLSLSTHPESYLTQFIAMDHLTMSYSWSEKIWLSELENPCCFAALYPQQGFIVFENNPIEDTLHLLKIGVLESQRGKGVAQFIFQEFLELISQERRDPPAVYLEVESKNSRAIGFYQKLGFKKLHLKKKFYSDGKDALSMIYEQKND